MAAKKKKTQLKPIVRGFATTSVPKKVVQEPESEKAAPESSVHDTERSDETSKAEDNNSTPKDPLQALSTEDQFLQSFVEKLQDKTEKEIARTVKSIEVDRRFSQTLPHLDIDPNLRDQIIASALNMAELEVHKGQKTIEGTEENVVAQLGITYGVLRRLGFREDRVNQCLKAINGVDLDEAFEWLYINCQEHELIPNTTEILESSATKHAGGVALKNAAQPKSSGNISHGSGPPSPAPSSPAPSSPAIHAAKQVNAKLVDISPDIKSRILAVYESNTRARDDDFDEPDPTFLYACLKTQHEELSSEPRSQLINEQLRQLEQNLVDISKDYLFNEKEALALYRKARDNAAQRRLQERLRSPLSAEPRPDVAPKKIDVLPPISTPSQAATDIFDDNDSDDSESTGLLGFLEDTDPNEITVKGVTYRLREIITPKHWSGPMPKTVLRDSVAKADKYAAISYTIISGQSRANRASISIAWRGNKRDLWSMNDIACPTAPQAEQYIATIALHSLTYPLTDGFISSSPASTGNFTFFRLLPPSYRDLWDELEADRKQRDNELNRAIWGQLLKIAKDKIQRDSDRTDKQAKQAPEKRPFDSTRVDVENKASLDSMSQTFQARQVTPAYQKMLALRNELPIAQYRDRIVEILEHNQVLVLSGETGCGKSTQVPAFFLEDHLARGKPCKIFCTEPRRISAISLAQRVSYELCDPPNSVGTLNSLVGYSIRLESNITRNTRLAFVTNGIALRMLESGSGQGGEGTAFDDITHLIIDEVHERTIESDFLLIVLKSLLVERPDLKVILMSATLDAEKIANYFDNCETLHVPGRTFPVNVQFLEDAIELTKWSISEDSPYARRLHDKYYKGKNRPEWTEDAPTIDDDDDFSSDTPSTVLKLEKRYSQETTTTLNTFDERLIPYDLIVRLLESICFQNQDYQSFSRAMLIFMPGLGEIRRLNDMLAEHRKFGSDEFKIYLLHSTLSNESQSAVFDLPPPGVRKIVIATNIAETGITIPDITCVIDTGKHREMRFDEKRQISRLAEMFIARSNAAQRRGRAGRVQHGLCFHLFTKTRHETQMADSPLPEMMRLSLSDLALRIKIMKIKLGASIEDVLVRALDPPSSINVQRAVSMLVEVRALTSSEEITPMGKLLSKLPTDVHLGKFLLIATIFRCLDPALTIAATLNSKSPFITPLGLEQEADRAKNTFRTENSDFLTIHNAFSSWRRACANPNFARKFCRTNFLSHQNLQQIEDLRQQFLGYLVDSSFVRVDKSFVRELTRARYSRNRTRFVIPPSELDLNSQNPLLVNAALTAGLYPKILSIDRKNGLLHTISNNQRAYLHPSSVNFGKNVMDFGVNHLAYFTLMHSKKLYAWETGPVDDLAMLLLCGECESKLISDTAVIDRKLKFTISPKTNVALKILRERLANLLALKFQGKTLADSQVKWMEIGTLALSRAKVKDEKDDIQLIAK